ncbi:hypothetical protein ACJMK2_018100 [Sinanodonta woodiana]|uniref:Vwde helical domain-containing protein n=1 Tax=Sinanodonta woodiana TaxID=1069815 RepID=A0ABD3UCG6_SINWO
MCVATLNIDIKPAIDMCVTDIKITDDLNFANSALQDVLETCSHEKLTRPDSYIKKNGTINPAPETKQCSGACSGQGDCIDGECQCNYYFEGEDCSIDKRQPPSIKEIFVTEGFFQTFKEETVPMGFISSNNVKCKIPADEVREKPVTVYDISISNHGQEYSREQLFVIYNGKCIECDEMGHCKQKLNTCLISDKCYTPGELDAITHKGICNPTTNPTGWTQVGGGFSHLPPSPTPTVNTPNIAPLGGQILPRPDVWTRNSTGCTCSFNNGRTDCACCEDGACQCPEGSQNTCSKCDDMDSCGEKKPSPEYGIDGWTAKFTGCFCLFDLNRADCACCQNFGCPCGYEHKNQCVECGHTNRCGTKPEIFGPAYQK